jgi:hypothetical protein
MQYLRARYYNPASGTFNRLDPFAGRMQDPQALHKYLYVHGDPIQGIDPSGLVGMGTPAFGYLVEAKIQVEYRMAFPPPFDVSYGGWSWIPGFEQAKPDILNRTTLTYNEIKPFSPTGVEAAAVQMALRQVQFGWAGYSPDPFWPNGPSETVVAGIPVLYFNLAGVIFYTDTVELSAEVVALSYLGFNAAFELLKSPQMARTLGVAIARAGRLVQIGIGSFNAGLQRQVSTTALTSTVGGFAF